MEQPLVSILMPVTGNPTYLELALTSVLLQTYTNIEIIIRDSSSTDEIQLLLEKNFLPYSSKIRYLREPGYLSKLQILQKMLQCANGTYINFILEKDLFYPTKIERMMNYFTEDLAEEIKLITSYSKKIDIHGNVIDNFSNNEFIYKNDLKLDSISSGDLVLKGNNFIGSLSAPLFRKKDLTQPFGYFAQHFFVREIEMASWLTLLSQGSFVLIADDLIFERVKTNSEDKKVDIPLIVDWVNFIKLGQQQGFLTNLSTKNTAIKRVLAWIDQLLEDKQNVLTLEERDEVSEYKGYLSFIQEVN
ncbi:glycosyltransferase family 2 protein [Bacillus sp. SN10]|uniref:glycosyltransferase family 2 protein n=1 Tax=Bacillus sp. SN10 TaxID=2056493 RepID=UPI0012FEFB6C|nr:glycosyltransferase [Bacillus sp. SN10]